MFLSLLKDLVRYFLQNQNLQFPPFLLSNPRFPLFAIHSSMDPSAASSTSKFFTPNHSFKSQSELEDNLPLPIKISENSSVSHSIEQLSGADEIMHELNFNSPDVSTPLARVRACDVYIGYIRQSPSLSQRLVKWLRAELDMLGVSCYASDRNRCKDAISHHVSKAAIDVSSIGIIIVTINSFSDTYAMEEMRIFSDRKKLLPVFIGLSKGDCVSRDVIEKRGDLWGRFGGQLWGAYGGLEREWRETVDGLSRVDTFFEANSCNLREIVLDLVDFVGKLLGKRGVVESVKKWREMDLNLNELPFNRNGNFVGRNKELTELESSLFGYVEGYDNNKDKLLELQKEKREKDKGKKALLYEEEDEGFGFADLASYKKGLVCVTGETGLGKTELLLEFAYRNSQRYKMVLWIGGEARFLRENYMKLLNKLGIEASIETVPCNNTDIEQEAINKVRKELTRDIPYLLIIDNLEMEHDFWDGRPITDLLPCLSGQTHVLISTRLTRVLNIRPFRVLYPSSSEAMSLIKGDNVLNFRNEDESVLRIIQEKIGRVPLGLKLIGGIISEFSIDPINLLELLENFPFEEILWSPKEDTILKHNPFLIQLLDVCFSLLENFSKGLKSIALKIIETSGWYGPSPVPVHLLIHSAWGDNSNSNNLKFWKKVRKSVLSFNCMSTLNAENYEAETLSLMVRLGLAKIGARSGQIYFHDIFKLYARKRCNNEPTSYFIKAIINEGFNRQYSDHIWSACFLALKFGVNNNALVVDLTVKDLLSFIQRLVMPLVSYCFNELSMCTVVLEILRVSTERLEFIENSFLSEMRSFKSSNKSGIESEPFIDNDVVKLRAVILENRVKIMIKVGKYDVAEDLCISVVSIKEVIYGSYHPQTESSRKVLDIIARAKSGV